MAKGDRPEVGGRGVEGGALEGESLAEVLASIRALVSAETEARAGGSGQADTVLMLTPDMRLGSGPGSGGLLAEGIEGGAVAAPALDEQALRQLINSIVREELQGELGDRIGRNLRKLIRREIVQILDERRQG